MQEDMSDNRSSLIDSQQKNFNLHSEIEEDESEGDENMTKFSWKLQIKFQVSSLFVILLKNHVFSNNR